MEHEILDAASRRDADQLSFQEPQQLLGRCLVDGGICGRYLTYGEVPFLAVMPENNPPAPIAGLDRGHATPVAWGQFGDSIGQREPNAIQVYYTQEMPQNAENQGIAACLLCR